MASVFTKIINRQIASHIVVEDNHFIAFLDIQPLTIGHTLVVPKHELDYIFDYDDEMIATLMVFAKKVALAIKQCITCKRVGVAIIGFEVPHAHVHLVPMNTMDDINFTNPKLTLSQEEFKATAQQIKDMFDKQSQLDI